ncbi:hypothetical protein, partial [Faecalibaculum rodentium]|uniref:hypothetical protein n=1 Tax=Faecalibaculum rodentium TaxID=1702221 RepID=UPI0025B0C0C2
PLYFHIFSTFENPVPEFGQFSSPSLAEAANSTIPITTPTQKQLLEFDDLPYPTIRQQKTITQIHQPDSSPW